ncbi:hypothetical protein B0H11DRAFT_2222389 [Mycena galericulata]|nr:hypothetical protein B0H11DRAFT_2222389 [Mycena galericulata]
MDHETGCLFAMFKCCIHMGRSGTKATSELVRAAMQFLLCVQTDAAHRALTEKLTSCSCRIYDNSYNPPATLEPAECLDLFITHLSDIVCTELRNVKPAKFRSKKPNRTPRRQPWPNGPADIGLGTRSCRELLEILLRWTSVAPVGSTIFSLLGGLSIFWNPLGEEILRSVYVVQRVRFTLLAATTFFQYPVPPMSVDFFRRAVEFCYKLPCALHHVDMEYATRYRHWTEGLYDLGVVLVPLLAQHTPRMDRERQWFSRMLHNKHLTVPGELPPDNANQLAMNDDYFQARYEMMLSARRRVCMNLGCAAPLDVGVATTLCSQCGVVSYCSTSCQKSAWQAARSPHKDICGLIGRIRDLLGLGRPTRGPLTTEKAHKDATRAADEAWRKWLMRTSAPNVRAVLREKGVTPRSCRSIWLYFLILKRAKGLVAPMRLQASATVWRKPTAESIKKRFATAYIEDFEVELS